MNSKVATLEQRIKDNVKNYSIDNLYQLDNIKDQLSTMAEYSDVDILVTDHYGVKVIEIGDFTNFVPNVVENPGRNLRIRNRTLAHIYLNTDRVHEEQLHLVEKIFADIFILLQEKGEEVYLHHEFAMYADELEDRIEHRNHHIRNGIKEDLLTATLNRSYFMNRLQVVERSEVVPVAVICGNINDWKYVNDHFGNQESDRLIKVIASILRELAKPEYLIGRVDGDIFHIVIPMTEEKEAINYCNSVQKKCLEYEDEKLAPSIAFGIVIKTNVEEKMETLFSDAEYEMFQDKFNLKNVPGYRERLEKYSIT